MLRPADERPHDAGDGPTWSESWSFVFYDGDADLGGQVRIELWPHRGETWYWASVVGAGRPLITVIDLDVPLPGRTGSLEIRSEGLWGDHIVETPFEHVTVGAEAFAVGVDDPTEVFAGELRGELVPFGLDLEWERVAGPRAEASDHEYALTCVVHGEVLLGTEVIDFAGHGHRDHRWGSVDEWREPWCRVGGRLDDGTRFVMSAVGDEEPSGFVAAPGGDAEPIGGPGRVVIEGELPSEARVELGPLRLEVEPVAWSPVPVLRPGGEQARLVRCLGRFRDALGRSGSGWLEWNRPSV